MSIGTIGKKSGNIVVPVTNLMRRTKWVDMGSAVSTAYAGDANVRCLARFFKDSNNVWFMEFNFVRSFTARSASSHTFTVANITFKNTSNLYSSPIMFTFGGTSAPVITTFVTPNSNTMTLLNSTSGTDNTGLTAQGIVELDSEPTTYTTSANMENVADIAVYIPFGQTGSPGEEKISTATLGSAGAGTREICKIENPGIGIWEISGVAYSDGTSDRVDTVAINNVTADTSTGTTLGLNKFIVNAGVSGHSHICIPAYNINVTSATADYFLNITSNGTNIPSGTIRMKRISA